MRDRVYKNAIYLIRKAYNVDCDAAFDALKIIKKVIHMQLANYNIYYTSADVDIVKKHILERLAAEANNPAYFENVERASVQTCIVIMVRETVLQYVRNAYYAHSALADIFRDMNVDVTGAEGYLEGLNELLSPSQKCVLRLMYGEGRTVIQAAEVLGVSPQVVRTIHRQASELLQQEWLALRGARACGEGLKQ